MHNFARHVLASYASAGAVSDNICHDSSDPAGPYGKSYVEYICIMFALHAVVIFLFYNRTLLLVIRPIIHDTSRNTDDFFVKENKSYWELFKKTCHRKIN